MAREHLNGDGRRMLNSLKQAVRDAWLVFARLPDVDARFRMGLRSGWTLPVVNAASDAYGYASASARAEYPSPRDISRMEIVMEWLAWLRREEGDLALRRVIGWARGTPLVLAHGERRCTRTIENRIDRSMAAILREFLAVRIAIPVVDEAPAVLPRITSFTERPSAADVPPEAEPGKVYIAGIGFMYRGARYKSALD
jgi:Domain of unknown function (DUF6362)